jgi:signal transduction histidine kinase
MVGGLAGVGLCTVTVALTLASPHTPYEGWAAAARAFSVGAPFAVGLYTLKRRPGERYAALLLVVGLVSFLTTGAESGNSIIYSVGRVAHWVGEFGLVYLILAFPSGRLGTRADRTLVLATALLLVTCYLPTAFLDRAYPQPSPVSSCGTRCPANAFFLGSEPAFLDFFLIPLREGLTILLFGAVAARLTQRFRRANPLMQRTLEPVLVIALGRCVMMAVAIGLRRVNPESALVGVLAWAIALSVPLMTLGFLLGLVAWRLYAAESLQALSARVRVNLSHQELQSALADALGDPSLRVLYWARADQGQWTDEVGRPTSPPGPESGQVLTEVGDADGLVAGIVHDAALCEEQAFLEAVAAYSLVALRGLRLTEEVESSLRELHDSRARIASSADAERRRIERNLHDGAQQRLVALRIQLELAEDLVQKDPESGVSKLHALGEEVGVALEEIRALAGGVYPSLLEERGLEEALRAATFKLPIPASLKSEGIGRYSPDVESAIYFCCLEAMQNASKHAAGANAISVSLGEDDVLWFSVRDDGAGFDDVASPPGAGLTNMRDRLAAVGGQLSVRSSAGAGTVVAGTVGLRDADGVRASRADEQG